MQPPPDCLCDISAAGLTGKVYSLRRLAAQGWDCTGLPYTHRVLLENLLRRLDGVSVTAADLEALISGAGVGVSEIAFMPARVVLQDFTGVPCLVDLASMRDAVAAVGGDPARVNPLLPVDLVIDHSVQVDSAGSPDSLKINTGLEFQRNTERYAFLKWGQQAFRNFRVVPPNTGIVHQVNLERLARVIWQSDDGVCYPDTVVGTDSHTTMINGLGILGWGVGGIEAEAAMLGQAISMLIPPVVGVRLTGSLPAGATATDLVLSITQMLRAHGVVGKFVEFTGPGLAALSLADRATIANMAPEYGATCGYFPIDQETLRYLCATGRPADHVELVRACAEELMLLWEPDAAEPNYNERLSLDLGSVEPCVAGPKRPQDRLPLTQVAARFLADLSGLRPASDADRTDGPRETSIAGLDVPMPDGAVAIAAITSCTNTSNPSVLMAAGLLARNARARGLRSAPWVKASLAPGSQVAARYLANAGLADPLAELGFHIVGFGCTTCIGNSGPLRPEVSDAIAQGRLVAAGVLSGNRNFEGRVHQEVRANYLMSPPLVVAYALAGRVDLDLTTEPLGTDADGQPVHLRDIWPADNEVAAAVAAYVTPELFTESYKDVFAGDANWQAVQAPSGGLFEWSAESTYLKQAPYFDHLSDAPADGEDVVGAAALALLGDSVTTDHISPAGSIKADSPAGRWLTERAVAPKDFNSYGSRRGHDQVMVRGTFANTRIRNRLAPGTEGGVTRILPSSEILSIYDGAAAYTADGVPLIVLAGKEYGSGSSRDWAAKGPYLQGVKAVIAVSFERIHRSNLVGMGMLPLQFEEGSDADSLGLTGEELFTIRGVAEALQAQAAPRMVTVTAAPRDGRPATTFAAILRIDTPMEVEYYRNGGILQYVARRMAE